MTDYISFSIPGRPVPKGHKIIRVRGASRIMINDKSRVWQDAAKIYAQQAMSGKEPFAGPVRVDIVYHIEVPKSWSGKKKKEAMGNYVTGRGVGDIDNFLENTFDVLNGIIIKDDSQIAEQYSVKYWWPESGTDVEVQSLE